MKKTGLSVLVFLAFTYGCTPSSNNKSEGEEKDKEKEEVVEEPSVFFENLTDGDSVESPFLVKMGLTGMEIQPAGEVNEGFGHHHILINLDGWPEGEVIPPSDTTIHYGKGQTETELTLEPGSYTIALQFADGVHRSYGESMAAKIDIIVK